ncbi:MAG: PEP-CTERM sorting domain-containing protein [PVC group bacterium]|nr:PEP-CTERM sorting domain-containing protein [PVC group bacterium]
MRNYNKILLVSLVLFLCLSFSSTAQANLLNNAGFETGNFDNWDTYQFGSQGVSNLNPHTGQYQARLYWDTWIRQTVALTPGVEYKASSWVYMPQDGGYATVAIIFYNSTGTTSQRRERSWDRYPGDEQYAKLETDWVTAPAFTAYAEVECSLTTSANYIDFDDVELVAIPEPSSMLLLLFGICGIFRFNRKKRSN